MHTVNAVSTPANGTIRVLVQTNLNCSNGFTVENELTAFVRMVHFPLHFAIYL